MTRFAFTLRLDGLAQTEEAYEAFTEAVCSPDVDCFPRVSCGVAEVDFRWEAPNLRDAVSAAVAYVRSAVPELRPVALELEGGHTLDEAFAA